MPDLPLLLSAPMVRAALAGSKRMTRRVVRPAYVTAGGAAVPRNPSDPRAWPNLDLDRAREGIGGLNVPAADGTERRLCLRHAPGVVVWFRETWRVGAWRDDGRIALDYRASPEIVRTPWCTPSDHMFMRLVEQSDADCRKANCATGPDGAWKWEHGKSPCRWRSPLHLPRWASRLTFPLTTVRFERLNDISAADCMAEGIVMVERESPRQLLFGVPGLDATWCDTPRDAFAALWDSVNGDGAWARNPWVVVFGWGSAP